MLFHLNLVFILIISTIGLPALAEGKFKIIREQPIDVEQTLLNYVEQESSALVYRMNQLLRIPKDIVFVFGAEDGPLYDSETYEILMPDSFTFEVMERFKNSNYVEKEDMLFEVTMDVIEHTLYHELGHALIDQLKLPVLGNEEDAADNLAALLVILTHEKGGEIALSAADLFDIEGSDIEEFTDEDFWSEHSLDYQRFYNTVCMIYGSQPDEYKYLIKELDITEDRADLCIIDFERQRKSWSKLLQPYLKDKSLLN